MAITYKLVEVGTGREINLVYDTASNQNYAMYTGSHTLDSPLDAKFHVPDDAPPELVDLIAGIRPMFFRTIIQGKDSNGQNNPDDVANNITALARWVDGPNQQAARYHILKNCNRIELHVAIDGATRTTIMPVVYGNMSTFASFFNEFGEGNQIAFGAPVSLFLEPAARGESFVLRNDLASSPHFLEDSNGDGLADGMVSLGAATTYSLATAAGNIAVGPKSQRFNVNNSSFNGFETDPVTASTSSTAVAYCWIRSDSGSYDPVTIQLMDGSSNIIDQVVFDPAGPAGYDNAYVTSGGTTFYRYVVSGTNSAANFKLRVARLGADASVAGSYFVSGMYLQTGVTAPPPGLAWCGTSSTIQNRYDPTNSNEGRINYHDTWGIPGDVDALVEIAATVSAVTGFPNRAHVSRIYDTSVLAAERLYWFDSLTAGGALDGSWSTPTDASRSGGSYLRLAASATGASGTFSLSLANDEGLRKFTRWPSRIYALTRTNNIHEDTGVRISALAGGATILPSGAKHTVANTWEWVDLGLLNPADAPLEKANTGGTPTLSLSASLQSATGTLDIDAIVAVPVAEDGFLIGDASLSFSANDIFYLLPDSEQFYVDSTASVDQSLGECWTCKAGPIMNRYIFNISGVSNAHNLTDSLSLVLTVTPRTRHIMGTK